jgi:hypothetical protein
MKDYRPAKKRATVSVGESVRILRELQEMSQSCLTTRWSGPESSWAHLVRPHKVARQPPPPVSDRPGRR